MFEVDEDMMRMKRLLKSCTGEDERTRRQALSSGSRAFFVSLPPSCLRHTLLTN